MKSVAIFFVIWIVLASIGYATGLFVFDPTHLQYMTKNGVGTYGRVVAKDADNHATLSYRYEVAGIEYTGTGHGGRDNPEFEEISIDDQVLAYYDSANPEISILGNPWHDLGAQYTGIAFTTIVFPIFPMISILGIYFGLRKSKKGQLA